MVEKAKSAQTVGILLGTLGVSKYMDVLQAVKSLCDIAEKQYYTFLMGKVNPAKLANFTEVDIYVLIACPENSMVSEQYYLFSFSTTHQLDSSEFFKPVVTPFELELACASNRSWTGRYTFEFDQIIESMILIAGFSLFTSFARCK